MPHVKAAAAAAISQGRAMCGRPPSLWMGVHAAMVDQTTSWPTTTSVDGRACSYGVSNDKAGVCGLWDACPIVVVAQRPVDWRLASSTRCGCAAAAD